MSKEQTKPTESVSKMPGRVMYIESKSGGFEGEAWIGRVTFSKTGRTLYYRGKKFQSLKGLGFKSNYFDVETGEHYWISGPKKRGGDRLYGGADPIPIDEDARVEYWKKIREQPGNVHKRVAN